MSVEAQAALAQGAASVADRLAAPDVHPALDDSDGWRELAAMTNEVIVAMNASLGDGGLAIETIRVGDVDVLRLVASGIDAAEDAAVHLDLHGGAYIAGGGRACRGMAVRSALRTGLPTWSVDYRMPPDHPHPAPVDDCLAVYRWLLDQHPADRIVVGGQSAGGNLAAALVHRARAEGLPVPGALILLTPNVDLAGLGDTLNTNEGIDTVLVKRISAHAQLYAGGFDVNDPFLSPLLGNLRGFPPTLLQSGTRDLLLSDTVRMHRALRAADVDAELHVWEAMPHGGFLNGAPEDDEIGIEIRRFLAKHFSS